MGRLSGTWLLSYSPDSLGLSAGLSQFEELIVVTPTCADGPCSASVQVKDPASSKTLRKGRFKLTASGYRFDDNATGLDVCMGADGWTVENGFKESFAMLLSAMAMPGSDEVIFEGWRTLTTTLTSNGQTVHCTASTYSLAVAARLMTKADLAQIGTFLSARPLPDLVGRPDFVVKISGVRMIYYSVAGDRASVLMHNWANASSSSTRCGLIDYSWVTGDRQTLSCAMSAWNPQYSDFHDPNTGACTVTVVSTGMALSMPIAKWTSPALVPRVLIPWWEATQVLVRDHEAGHFAIDRQYDSLLKSRLNGVACAARQGIINRWSNELHAAQEAYDKKEYSSEVWPPYPL